MLVDVLEFHLKKTPTRELLPYRSTPSPPHPDLYRTYNKSGGSGVEINMIIHVADNFSFKSRRGISVYIIYINGATQHKRSQTFFEQIVCDFFQNYVGEHCGVLYITQRNSNSSTQQNRLNKSRIQAKIHLFFIAFCKVHLRSLGFKDDPEGFVQYALRISTVDYLGGRIAFHFFVIKPFKEEKEMKIRSTYLPLSL